MASVPPSTTLRKSDRPQRTIATQATVTGVGLFTNADVTVRFLPAQPETGIVFRRLVDGRETRIPAHIGFLVDTPRHTSLCRDDVSIEMVEHTLAALAGLQIDNCIVEVDGPELPGLDGSSAPTVNALLQAGIVEQPIRVRATAIEQPFEVQDGNGGVISAEPVQGSNSLEITYLLDHPEPVIGRQSAAFSGSYESFVDEIAPARTFVLSSEVDALLAAGYGKRLTHRDLCVFGADGLIDNTIRYSNEPARHKLLDCIGDFALAGIPLSGRIVAAKSGHALNHRFVRKFLELHPFAQPARPKAAA